jgi:hypothetical protein
MAELVFNLCPYSRMENENQLPPENLENPTPAPAAPDGNAPTIPPEDIVDDAATSDGMEERLERLGGEPAPVITPEEFARLQRAGQVHIDARGRVRPARRSGNDAGVSLRKRRAWYGH